MISLKTTRIVFLLLLFSFLAIALQFNLSSFALPGYAFYDVKRLAELIFLVIIAVGSLFEINKQTSTFYFLPSTARFLLLMFLALGLYSSLMAPLPRYAFLEVSLYFLLFNFVMAMARMRIALQTVFDRILLLLLIVSVAIYSVTFYSVYFVQFFHHESIRNFPGFMNPVFFIQFSIITLPLVFLPFIYFHKQASALRILLFLIAISWWSLIPFEKSKGVFIALLGSTLGVYFIFGKRSLTWLKCQALFFISGLIFYALIYYGLPYGVWFFHFLIQSFAHTATFFAHAVSFSHTATFSAHAVSFAPVATFSAYAHHAVLINPATPIAMTVSAHVGLIKQSLHLLKTHALFGIGPMHFAYYPNPFAADPNDDLLLLATEWGIPAVLMAVTLLVWGLISWAQRVCRIAAVNDRLSALLIQSLTAAFLAGVSYSVMNGMLVAPLSQMSLAIIIAWMLGIYYQNKNIPRMSSGYKSVLFAVVVVLAIVGVIVGTVGEIANLPNQEIRWYLAQYPDNQFFTRFWLQGWLIVP